MPLMRLVMLLFFLALPFIEIAVLIQVGRFLGVWPTLALLLASAAVGLFVIRREGTAMLARVVNAASEGRLAIVGMLDTYAAIAAGCLLIIPGFVTDALGLVLLVPPFRRRILAALLPGLVAARPGSPGGGQQPDTERRQERPIIIEGTYERIDDEPEEKR